MPTPGCSAGPNPSGRSLSRQDGSAVHIESVLPPRFLFPRARVRPRIDALEIVRVGALADVERGEGTAFRARPFTVVARLQDGITRDQDEAALRASLAGASGLTVSVHISHSTSAAGSSRSHSAPSPPDS